MEVVGCFEDFIILYTCPSSFSAFRFTSQICWFWVLLKFIAGGILGTGFITMSRVYVGNLDPRASERDLEDEFRVYGVLRSIWVARRPPGYAFVEFDDHRDALDAIRALDGKNGWRVELSHNSKGGGGGRGGGGRGRGRGGDDMKCYECGEPGHFARECRLRVGSGGVGSGRRRSPSPRYRRSPSYGRRSYSPRGKRSPRNRSLSPRPHRSDSRSPDYRRTREDSPYANGAAVGAEDNWAAKCSRS